MGHARIGVCDRCVALHPVVGLRVSITLTTLALGFVATPAFASLLAGPLASVGVPAGAGIGRQILALVLAGVLDDLRCSC